MCCKLFPLSCEENDQDYYWDENNSEKDYVTGEFSLSGVFFGGDSGGYGHGCCVIYGGYGCGSCSSFGVYNTCAC